MHVAEFLHLLEIEVSPEETCKSHISVADFLVLAVAGIIQQRVEFAEVGERPAAAGSRNHPAVTNLADEVDSDIVVTIFIIKPRAREMV